MELKAYQAVAEVVEDPELSIQVIDNLSRRHFMIVEAPSKANKLLPRVGRLVTETLRLQEKLQRIARGEENRPSPGTMRVLVANESAWRAICTEFGVDFADPVSVAYHLKHGCVGSRDHFYREYLEAHPGVEKSWQSPA